MNPDKLIHEVETERKFPEDFRDYWILFELFEKVRNGDTLPKEV